MEDKEIVEAVVDFLGRIPTNETINWMDLYNSTRNIQAIKNLMNSVGGYDEMINMFIGFKDIEVIHTGRARSLKLTPHGVKTLNEFKADSNKVVDRPIE